MATRRMRIKAVIKVPRSTAPKSEPLDEAPPALLGGSGTGPESPSPAILGPSSPIGSPKVGNAPLSPAAPIQEELPPQRPPPTVTPPPTTVIDRILPSSPKSPRPSPAHNTNLQRPSPSKSPASYMLPASGTILRRSPSPALARLSNSPGPPIHYQPHSPVKSPIPSYSSPSSPVKFNRTPVVIIPSSSSSSPTTVQTSMPGGRTTPSSSFELKSPPPPPPPSYFKPPPQNDFRPINSPSPTPSPQGVSRPSPAQSPVYGASRLPPTSFLLQHLNSNSNSSTDSHEVASLMSPNSNNFSFSVPSPNPNFDPSKAIVRAGAFSSVSNKVNSTPSTPSFSKTMFDDPESLKKRLEDTKKKEGGAQANPTKFATVRKEFYEKLHAGQAPEKSKMTMLHFTFYNPPNPNAPKQKRSNRSRASSICSDVSVVSKKEEDIGNNENLAKASSAPSSIAGSRRTTASSIGSGGSVAGGNAPSEAGSAASTTSSNGTPSGPRVKVGPDGKLIIDEKSLVVETSESQRARQQIDDMEVVSGADYAVGSSGFYRYKKTIRRGNEWTERETIRFYRALNMCGTDFSMMQDLFPFRTRHELKSKFKREDKKNPDMISKVLQSCVFDPSEAISSDEEETNGKGKPAQGQTEKERLLNEEKEIEQVICSSSDQNEKDGKPGRKKKGKKVKEEKEITLTAHQIKDMQANTVLKGPGMGKGRKWNTPVEGLVGGKLPPENKKSDNEVPGKAKVKVKNEKTEQEQAAKKPRKRKKNDVTKQLREIVVDEDSTSTPAPGTVSIIIAPGVLSTPIVPVPISKPVKKEKQNESPTPKQPSLEMVKSEPDPKAPPKMRNRLPKVKPKVKKENSSGEAGLSLNNNTGPGSSQAGDSAEEKTSNGVCDDLFRFDASDPLGLKVLPAPIPVAQETELVGDEEGREGLVIVDLDELNSVQAQAYERQLEMQAANSSAAAADKLVESPSKTTAPTSSSNAASPATSSAPTRRKRKKVVPTPVTTARVIGDPYGKPTLTPTDVATTEMKASTSTDAHVNKKLKVLPYRVPGPGLRKGVLPSPTPASLADELEIEIQLNTTTASGSES